MHMALDTHRWTRADLARLPDDGNRYEIIHGALLVSPAPRPEHQALVYVLRRLLEAYCDREGLGELAEVSAFVADDSEVIPDLVVRNRLRPPPRDWDDAPMPLLVVEVISESTRSYDEIKKSGFYVESGVPEYWVVDGKARTIRVISASGDRVESKSLAWQPPGAQSPLQIDLPFLFAEALG
jgi:Uma2 family endonuclease